MIVWMQTSEVVCCQSCDDCYSAHQLAYESSPSLEDIYSSSIVEDAPPTIPARKDDFGSIDL